jgi:hypothetical protein
MNRQHGISLDQFLSVDSLQELSDLHAFPSVHDGGLALITVDIDL